MPAVEADASQLCQILINLVINAAEAIGNQVGAIKIETGTTTISKPNMNNMFPPDYKTGNYVFIRISDTGKGVDEKTMQHLFEPFFTTKEKGHGLGLSIVYSLLKQHNGCLSVSSTPGKGTIFTLYFPVSEKKTSTTNDTIVPDVFKSKGLILLADDDESALSVAKKMLEKCGFSVISAKNGKEALNIFHENADKLSCVILNLKMPQMDGDEVLRKISHENKNMPVIIISGCSYRQISDRLINTNFSAFIQKPYTFETMTSTLRKIIKDHPK